MKTIARNATRKIAAIRDQVTSCRAYSLHNNFVGKDCDPEWALSELGRFDFARLVEMGPFRWNVNVHSNLWYELQAVPVTASGVEVPTYAQFRDLDCGQRHVMVRAMSADTRPTFLARLEWDDCEFLAESAFLSRDHVYRDQVIDRLEELAKGWQESAIRRYRMAAEDQDASRGRWAR